MADTSDPSIRAELLMFRLGRRGALIDITSWSELPIPSAPNFRYWHQTDMPPRSPLSVAEG
jgi:hypothetical protein